MKTVTYHIVYYFSNIIQGFTILYMTNVISVAGKGRNNFLKEKVIP